VAIARLDGGRRLVSILAADQLVDETLAAAFPAIDRSAFSSAQVSTEATEPVLRFVIGGESYGLPLTAIDEIARLPARLTRLPGAAPFVRGLMNLRGRAIPVIDQPYRFDGSDTATRRAIVARSGERIGAFLVDAITGVSRVPMAALDEMPSVGGSPALFDTLIVDGTEGPLTLMMSPFALLDSTERDLLFSLDTERGSALS
jgi:purine-binding chemotaxis protein CheW